MKMEGVICEEEEYRVKECEKMSLKLIIDTKVKTGRFQLKVRNSMKTVGQKPCVCYLWNTRK